MHSLVVGLEQLAGLSLTEETDFRDVQLEVLLRVDRGNEGEELLHFACLYFHGGVGLLEESSAQFI